MEISAQKEITIDSEVFDDVRESFDLLMQGLFKKMEQNKSDEGSITLKVDIEIQTDYVSDADGNTKMIHKPILKHKVSTTVPVKDSSDGKQDTGMDLVFDENSKRYVLEYVTLGRQRSIFDPEYADVVDCGYCDEPPRDEKALPGETNLLECAGGDFLDGRDFGEEI